ncbi:MAG: branched-chain amino acid ABC transporter permease [Halapricum sp.]
MGPDPPSHRAALTATVLGALALSPLVLSDFLIGILTLSFVYAVFALSVDLVWGYAGVLTFGHAAFFGTGAYAMALLRTEGVVVGAVVAVAAAGLLAVSIAAPLFRRGVGDEYFAIITLAVAVVATRIARSWGDLTGGSNGLLVDGLELPLPSGTATVSGDAFYLLALAALVGAYLLVRRIVRSPLGLSVVGIARNERKARSLGYEVARYRTAAFGLSGALAGFAGALYALHSGFVSPPLLGFELSTAVLIWVLVGGRGTLSGPVAGAVSLTVFENLLSGVFVFWWTFVLGLTLVVVVVAAPGGLHGVLGRVSARMRLAGWG